ncbi:MULTISPECIES: hypothetical protein [unclassified Agrococcus]|uniref:hypothetical protein n=1 Tax=unclassified Agrococcus TaxID=2615065 RepID=UPI00360B1718
MTPHPDAHEVAEAIASALDRLARTLGTFGSDDLAQPSRIIGTTRREAVQALLGHVDRTVAALHRRRAGRAPADPRDASRLACGDGGALADAVAARGPRVEAAARRLSDAASDERCDVRDDLEALLARVELAHVALDARYDLTDLPPVSATACAILTQGRERPQDDAEQRRRVRAIARRRGAVASPRGRRAI